MPKIKILHIIKSLGRGGAEMLLPETLKLHNKENFDFHYIYFLPWKNQMVSAIEEAGGKVINYPASGNFNLILQYSKVIDYCTAQKIDIIHCHLPWSGFLGRIVHKKTGIPVVYTEHNIQEKYHVLTKTINKYTFDHQSVAIGVSKDVQLSIMKNINPVIPVRTVLNGVNTGYFKKDKEKGKSLRKELGIPEDAIVIGNVAVFREQKGIPDWINAFDILQKSNKNVYGLLVGAGPKETEIKRQIQDRDLAERIKLPGLQTNTLPYFSAMDIFMMSSIFEGLPVALLEAMSMECAIASTRAGGVVEVIEDGKNGLLCEVGDSTALAQATQELINSSEKRGAFQKAARQRVEETFSLDNMVRKLETIYSEFQ